MGSLPRQIGRYRVLKRLGEGNMGVLYLAKDPEIQRLVAVKVLEHGDSDELRERFAREAIAVGKLTHQNIVIVFDAGMDDEKPFMVMEYVEGRTLSKVIAGRPTMALRMKVQLIEQLCAGLAYAHRIGVVHRDIKPANLIIDVRDTLKILDFGLARMSKPSMAQFDITVAGTVLGTFNYMAPEQLMGKRADHRADVFAVGAVMYELLSYEPAFPGGLKDGLLNRVLHEAPRPLGTRFPGVDAGLVRIVDRALEKDRDSRYQDLDTMTADIVRWRLGVAEETPRFEVRQDRG